MKFTYEIISHTKYNKTFAKVKLHLLGYATEKTHPQSWDYELLVPTNDLSDWPLGSYVLMELNKPTQLKERV